MSELTFATLAILPVDVLITKSPTFTSVKKVPVATKKAYALAYGHILKAAPEASKAALPVPDILKRVSLSTAVTVEIVHVVVSKT